MISVYAIVPCVSVMGVRICILWSPFAPVTEPPVVLPRRYIGIVAEEGAGLYAIGMRVFTLPASAAALWAGTSTITGGGDEATTDGGGVGGQRVLTLFASAAFCAGISTVTAEET